MDFFVMFFFFLIFTVAALVIRGLCEKITGLVNLMHFILGGIVLIMLYIFIFTMAESINPWLFFPGILSGSAAGFAIGIPIEKKIKEIQNEKK